MKIPISQDRLEQILNSVKKLTMGVVGDFTLDGYWYADMEQSQLFAARQPLFHVLSSARPTPWAGLQMQPGISPPWEWGLCGVSA